MKNVTKLPTAATSYYTVYKSGQFFDVVLVTPYGTGKGFKTRLYRVHEEQHAHDMARAIATDMKRPFKMRGVKS